MCHLRIKKTSVGDETLVIFLSYVFIMFREDDAKASCCLPYLYSSAAERTLTFIAMKIFIENLSPNEASGGF